MIALKALLAMAVFNLIGQTNEMLGFIVQASPPEVVPWWTQAEHLTLSSAMLIALVILWRAFEAKDNLLVISTKQVTEALAVAAASNVELRKIIEESVGAKRELSEEIRLLRIAIYRLPCTSGVVLDDAEIKRIENKYEKR